jgi:DNA-binding XRE family transcriptional regulator
MALSHTSTVRKQVVVAHQPNVEFKIATRYSKNPTMDLEDGDIPVKQKAPSVKQHDRLIAARREFGMTQDDFAKKAGVSKKEITECESGKSTIPLMLWNKVDKAIGSIRREKAKEAEVEKQKQREYKQILEQEKKVKLAKEDA